MGPSDGHSDRANWLRPINSLHVSSGTAAAQSDPSRRRVVCLPREKEQPINSTEAKIVADYLVGNFESEMQTTVGVLAAVPNDKLAYQPDSLAKSWIGPVRHIVLEDEWLLNSIGDGQFNPPPDNSDARPCKGRASCHYFNWLTDSAVRSSARAPAKTPANP